jgi:hypothetical protein
MKTYKDFHVELEEKSLIDRAREKWEQYKIRREADKRRQQNQAGSSTYNSIDLKTSKPNSISSQNIKRDPDPVSRAVAIKKSIDDPIDLKNSRSKESIGATEKYLISRINKGRPKPFQPPPITDSVEVFQSDVIEEKEANAENCSDLPPNEKKKERQLDIEKINKRIKPHHKKIKAKR